MPVATLVPVPQDSYLPAGLLDGGPETPSVFGSVSDGSDATYTQLEGQTVDGLDYGGVLAVEFPTLEPGQNPTAMHMMIRARNGEPFPTADGQIIQTYYFRVGESDPYDAWAEIPGSADGQLKSLTHGDKTDFADYRFYFMGSTPPNPTTPDGNWLTLGEEASWAGYNAWEGLTFGGGGLRFTIYNESAGVPTRYAYLDVAEVRLIVAYDEASGPRRRPLRQFPRSDGLGMSSARRQDANRSMQASLRRGGGVYF